MWGKILHRQEHPQEIHTESYKHEFTIFTEFSVLFSIHEVSMKFKMKVYKYGITLNE